MVYIHTGGASCDLATLLHAVDLALSIGIGLAHHVVVIVRLASCADEERGREQGSRTGADFLDLGNVVRERGGVDEDVLVESGNLGQREVGGKRVSGFISPGLPGRHVVWCCA